MKIPWAQIEELTKYLKEKGLTEISIETTEGKITIKKDVNGIITSQIGSQTIEEPKAKSKEIQQESKKSGQIEIISPMVGTFYGASSPGQNLLYK